MNTPLTRRAAETSRPNLASELRIRSQLVADGLYRHRPATRGDTEEHPPHATLAQLSYQPVRTYRLRIAHVSPLTMLIPTPHR